MEPEGCCWRLDDDCLDEGGRYAMARGVGVGTGGVGIMNVNYIKGYDG